eukprot:3908546-Amphidinium_carterae.1
MFSSTPVLNFLGAEVALELELRKVGSLVVVHVPGSCNVCRWGVLPFSGGYVFPLCGELARLEMTPLCCGVPPPLLVYVCAPHPFRVGFKLCLARPFKDPLQGYYQDPGHGRQ